MARVDDALHGSGPAGGRIRPILQRGEGGGAGRPAAQKRSRGVSRAFLLPSRRSLKWPIPHVSLSSH